MGLIKHIAFGSTYKILADKGRFFADIVNYITNLRKKSGLANLVFTRPGKAYKFT
jgi:hypothetical protein